MARKDITDEMVVEAYAEHKQIVNSKGFIAIVVPGVPYWPYETLSAKTGEPEKVCFRACERAFNHGLIDYGVSLRSGWLTEKGLALLENASIENAV